MSNNKSSNVTSSGIPATVQDLNDTIIRDRLNHRADLRRARDEYESRRNSELQSVTRDFEHKIMAYKTLIVAALLLGFTIGIFAGAIIKTF